MGIGLPVVGYVAATAHGSNAASKPNMNKRAEVDTFIGLVRIAFLDGWADGLMPSGIDFRNSDGVVRIPEKNFEHRIYFDTDLEKRPQLLAAINFLKSDPSGGSLCVISIDDIKVPTGPEIDIASMKRATGESRRTRSVAQCYVIHELALIPIIECGRRRDATSLVSKFACIPSYSQDLPARSEVVNKLLEGSLRANAANAKRLETDAASCIVGQVLKRGEKERKDFLNDLNLDLVCEKCASRLRGPFSATPRKDL